VPLLKKYLENIPIDRVDIYSEGYDLKLEDIHFSATDILPEYINFFTDSKTHVDLREDKSSSSRTRFWIEISNIRPSLKNFKFSYQKKTFPRIDDYGTADLRIEGQGLQIKLVWDLVVESGKPTRAVLQKTRVKIDRVDIHVGSETKHAWLDKIFLTFLTPRIKSAMTGAIEEYFFVNIGLVNDQLNNFFKSQPIETLMEKFSEKITSTEIATK